MIRLSTYLSICLSFKLKLCHDNLLQTAVHKISCLRPSLNFKRVLEKSKQVVPAKKCYKSVHITSKVCVKRSGIIRGLPEASDSSVCRENF